jgi:hypothetical protein
VLTAVVVIILVALVFTTLSVADASIFNQVGAPT